MIKIVPIHKKHIRGFHGVLDKVAREGKYLLLLKAPALANVKKFVSANIKNEFSQFVALDQERVIGWCDIIPNGHPSEKHVGRLGVGLLPQYRGQGIGIQLVQVCLKHAKSRGLEAICLDVFGSNKKALGFYKKLHFRIIGKLEKAENIKGNMRT